MDFAKLVSEQKPFDGVFVMDVHTHCGGDPSCRIAAYDEDGLIATMDPMAEMAGKYPAMKVILGLNAKKLFEL